MNPTEVAPMTNDAKLGMVAGVAGVIVAAVLLSGSPPGTQTKPGANAEPPAKGSRTTQPNSTPPTAAVTPTGPETNAVLASTLTPRTRKDVDAQPASRQGGADEEP